MNCLLIQSNSLDFRINELVENAFKFTLDKNPRSQSLVYLEDIASGTDKTFIDLELLEHALFERLLLDKPESCLVKSKNSNGVDVRVTSTECMVYLFECYKDLSQYRCKVQADNKEWLQVVNQMIELVVRNAATALKQPDLYEGQNVHAQVWYKFDNYMFPDV